MNARLPRLVLVGTLLVLFALSLSGFLYINARAGMTPAEVAGSAPLLAIPLALLYFSIGVIVEAWRQRRSQGRVSGRMARFIYRTPRIAGVLIALFTGLFALDVFAMEGTLWMKLGGFLIHAAPSIVMILVLVLAWRREWIGALVFGLAALFFMRTVISASVYSIGNLLLFVLPMALVAALFWLNWRWRGELRNA